MPSNFLKNLLRKENVPLLTVILLVFLTQLIFSAYFIFDGKRNQGEPKLRIKEVEKSLTLTEEGDKAASKVDDQAMAEGPQLQVSASDPNISVLINKVFKHIFLPNGDVRVETIVKPDELRKVNPVFYQMAKEGDQILVYSDRAILYDPVADKVLDVMHISK